MVLVPNDDDLERDIVGDAYRGGRLSHPLISGLEEREEGRG